MRGMLIGLIALAPCVSQADVSLTYPQQAQCTSNVSAIQISASHLRLDSAIENKKYSMLLDGAEDMITMLDHSARQYHLTEVDDDALDYNKDVMSSTGTFMDKQMQAMQAQMKQQCVQMEKQGMSCPNMDLSSIMQTMQASAGQGAAKIEIKPSEKNKTVAGMACKSFDRYENGKKKSEECYIEAKDAVMSDKDKKYLLRNMKVMFHYSDSFSGLSEKFKMIDANQPTGPDPANKDILLSKTCYASEGSEAGRIEVQINNSAIDPTSFDIPAGYTSMSMQ